MARLPIVHGDQDAWGDILNTFLGVEFNPDGTLANVARPADVTAEAAARAAADTAEATARAAADTTLTTNLATETTNRTNADTTEATARASADATHAALTVTAHGGITPPFIPTAVKTSAYNAAAQDLVPVDTTSGPVTITLPTAPADNTRVAVKMVIQGGTNAVTINTGTGSDKFNKAGGATTLTLPLLNQGVVLQYKNSTAIWYVVSDDLALSQLDTRYFASTVDLVGAKYRLVSDGTNVTAYDHTGTSVSTGTDGGAVLTAILPAASGPGVTIEFRNDGNVFPWRTTPLLPKGLTSKLLIKGNGAIVQAAVSAGRRFLDFNRTADYDTFQNIEIWDLVFDRNSFTASTNETVFLGNGVGGAFSQRINFKNIVLRRCKTINMPIGGTGATFSFGIAGAHLASNEGTQTVITNIVQEDCEWGGDYGYAIFGTAAAGGSVTAGQGINCFYDEIHVIRGIYDRGSTPAGFYGSGCQIGGYAYGRKVRITDWTSKNAGDVGIEIDNCQDLVGVGNHIVDPWNCKYLVGNFRPPIDVRSQKNTWRDCHCENIAFDRVNRESVDFSIFGSPNNASATSFGELVVENFTSTDEITTAPFSGAPHFHASAVDFRKLVFKGKIGYSALNITTGGNTFIGIQLRNTVNPAAVDIDITYTLAGSRSGSGNNQWKMTDINGLDTTVKARVAFDILGLTGLSAASDTFYWIGIALLGASTLRLESLTPVCLTTLGATQGTHHGVYFSANWSLGGARAYVEKMDMVKAPGAQGFDVNISNLSAANAARMVVRNIVSQRTSASGSGPVTAPTAMTGLVSGTGLAIGSVNPSNKTTAVPMVVQFVQGSGAGITAIDFSTDNGTTYTNLLTQASGAMPAGADLVIGPLPPDALIKVTFATTQPTINLVPANA